MVTIVTIFLLMGFFAVIVSVLGRDKNMAINAVITFLCAFFLMGLPRMMAFLTQVMAVSQ